MRWYLLPLALPLQLLKQLLGTGWYLLVPRIALFSIQIRIIRHSDSWLIGPHQDIPILFASPTGLLAEPGDALRFD
jgi:hypothetical protein